MGLSADALELLAHAGELHDIGKVAIPDAILHKPGPLDESEWEFVRRHPVIGERIIAPPRAARWRESCALTTSASTAPATPMAWPRGDPARRRIVAVCDAYDAMTSPSLPGRDGEVALDELRRCAGDSSTRRRRRLLRPTRTGAS